MLIEMFADVVCPWCYLGRRRLGRALAMRPHVPVRVRWQPFQLNPDMPREGMDRRSYLIAKLGGVERVRSMNRTVEGAAEADGVPLALDRIRRVPNSVDAHRLVRLAQRRERGDAMLDALMNAYFVEGEDIGDRDALASIAAGIGFDADETTAFLAGDGELAGVRASDVLARQLGLQAVPCFVFNQRFALSGAQEPLTFLPLLAIDEDEEACVA